MIKNTAKRLVALILALIAVFVLVSCGKCEHDYKDGICTLCGEDDHDYVKPCNHTYSLGVCTSCGSFCKHSFANGACTICGFVCTHSYANGACITCGISCTHNYVDSVCTICGIDCAHIYNEGICENCGAEDPDYIPADGGESLYNEIVEKYKYLVLYKYMNEELPQKGDNAPFYIDALYEVVGQFDPTKNLGYAFKDIDGDGYVELFLTENSNRIYAMFTILDKSPNLVSTFQQGMGYLGPSGTVFFNYKKFDLEGGQIYLGNHITRLVKGELVGIAYGWEDSDEDYGTQNDEVYFIVTEDGTKNVLSYEEYKEFRSAYQYFWEYPTRLTKLNHLQFKSALTDVALTDIVADFSTYEAIIKTFALMHSEVAGGKYVRSKWVGGEYDNGMVFESYEDFVIYDKLLSACVLVQNNQSAKFGYARADINGDGVEELILLESKYHVLAIFTEVDGKVELVDSYTDTRSAFIDREGNIHVCKKTVPGGSEDYEYFVYEIEGGKAVAKIAIAQKTNYDGTQTFYYRINGTTYEEIEKSEFDELYTQYAGDIAEESFSSYTKNKSGLTFVLATAD